MEVLAAEVANLLENAPVAEVLGAKLSRLLHGFLQGDVLPQAERAADLALIRRRCSPSSPMSCGSTSTPWSPGSRSIADQRLLAAPFE
jgi:hypothetical protein